MCSQYWPLHMKAAEKYGIFQVELIKEERYAHYKVRHFNLSLDDQTRQVTQFHYTSWPLSAQPDKAHLLLFRRHIWSHIVQNAQDAGNSGPPLVHCHDGGGRSGTFLAIEANMSMVESRSSVDSKCDILLDNTGYDIFAFHVLVVGTVAWLHKQRAQLVSHPGFYKLIYDILEDYIKCGDSSLELQVRCLCLSKLDHVTDFQFHIGHAEKRCQGCHAIRVQNFGHFEATLHHW